MEDFMEFENSSMDKVRMSLQQPHNFTMGSEGTKKHKSRQPQSNQENSTFNTMDAIVNLDLGNSQ